MASSSAHSNMKRSKSKRVVTCGCGDVCRIWVSRTPENPGKRFWGCPNYLYDEGCGYFKWVDQECVSESNRIAYQPPRMHMTDHTGCSDDGREAKRSKVQENVGQTDVLLKIIVALLFAILMILTVVVVGKGI